MTLASTPAKRVSFTHSIGDIVYHRLAAEREPGLVTGLFVRPGCCGYNVTWPDCVERTHYEMELTTEYLPDYGAIS
jgi:hypothetical protein